MRKLAASVTVVTTELDGLRYGLTASAVTSLSAQPPSLLACVNREAKACAPIAQAQKFCINILSRNQKDISEAFAIAPQEERFSVGTWSKTLSGMPLLTGAAASFECAVMDVLPGFTHDVFIGLITQIHLSDGAPLLYADGEYGHFNLPTL